MITPAIAFVPATTALIRRSPTAPPPGAPRGRVAAIPADHRFPTRPGDQPTTVPNGWTATGTAFRGALPGTLPQVGFAGFGQPTTGSTRISRTTAGTGGGRTTAGSANASGSTIHRAFELPSVSALFERARAWFGGTDDPAPGDRTATDGPLNPPTSAQQAVLQQAVLQQGVGLPRAQDGQLVVRPRSLSELLRARSSMTEINDRSTEEPLADALSPREWDQLVDLVVERIEDRVSDELARRGRRFSPGVF
ncbi:MAG: hypothetical protein ABJD68_02740 [Nakamurella sp.]